MVYGKIQYHTVSYEHKMALQYLVDNYESELAKFVALEGFPPQAWKSTVHVMLFFCFPIDVICGCSYECKKKNNKKITKQKKYKI